MFDKGALKKAFTSPSNLLTGAGIAAPVFLLSSLGPAVLAFACATTGAALKTYSYERKLKEKGLQL